MNQSGYLKGTALRALSAAKDSLLMGCADTDWDSNAIDHKYTEPGSVLKKQLSVEQAENERQ